MELAGKHDGSGNAGERWRRYG